MTIASDPETLQVLGAMAMMNMEGEGIDDVRGFFRKRLLRMGVVQPTKQEAQDMAAEQQNQQPDPNALYLQAAAQQAEAEAAQARSSTVLNVAKAEKTQAETMKIVTETDATQQQQALEVIDRFEAGMQPPAPDVTVVAVEPPRQI